MSIPLAALNGVVIEQDKQAAGYIQLLFNCWLQLTPLGGPHDVGDKGILS